jgi:hypothetical protein
MQQVMSCLHRWHSGAVGPYGALQLQYKQRITDRHCTHPVSTFYCPGSLVGGRCVRQAEFKAATAGFPASFKPSLIFLGRRKDYHHRGSAGGRFCQVTNLDTEQL